MKEALTFFAIGAVIGVLAGSAAAHIARAQTFHATTTVSISVCGDGLVTPPEVCDDGVNNGQYSTSTTARNCLPDCSGWAPYCGDGILQQAYGEQCDDSNNTSGDGCSATCQIESTAPQPGPAPAGGGGGPYGGGSYTPTQQTEVIVKGKAYPGSDVNILKDGTPIGIVKADSSANFYFSTYNVSPGVTTFGFWAQDSDGLKSIALTSTFTVTANAITTVAGEYLPPTIAISSRQVAPGATLTVKGQSVPNVNIETQFHSTNVVTETTSTDSNGLWELLFDTSKLSPNALHTVAASFNLAQSGTVAQSTFGQTLSFYVGTGVAGKTFLADLNGDGKVNLADFSIMLYYWGTSTPLADLNGDGTVDLQDFSILLYNWTG